MSWKENIREGLYHRYLATITTECRKKKWNSWWIKKKTKVLIYKKDLQIELVMEYRTTRVYIFRARLEFKSYDVILSRK